jgi:hypothetical protein
VPVGDAREREHTSVGESGRAHRTAGLAHFFDSSTRPERAPISCAADACAFGSDPARATSQTLVDAALVLRPTQSLSARQQRVTIAADRLLPWSTARQAVADVEDDRSVLQRARFETCHRRGPASARLTMPLSMCRRRSFFIVLSLSSWCGRRGRVGSGLAAPSCSRSRGSSCGVRLRVVVLACRPARMLRIQRGFVG